MIVYYSDPYTFPLPEGHRFPAAKYAALRHELLRQGVLRPDELCLSQPVEREDLLLAHTREYVDAVDAGTLTPRQERATGLPWSPELVLRSKAAVGGSLAAAQTALRQGISGNLAGGTHHALAGEGQGFCVYNDLAVVARALLSRNQVHRIAIVDLDVHQGNGNAAILGGDPGVFVFSMHGEKNFPYRKVDSNLDIGLPDGTGDDEYLDALAHGLERVFAFHPELLLFIAGADPLAEDRLGRLSLTLDGLARRDRAVIGGCVEQRVPVALVLGGGYAVPLDLTVQVHVQTYRVAKELHPEQNHPTPTSSE